MTFDYDATMDDLYTYVHADDKLSRVIERGEV